MVGPDCRLSPHHTWKLPVRSPPRSPGVPLSEAWSLYDGGFLHPKGAACPYSCFGLGSILRELTQLSKVFFSFCPACRVKLTPLYSLWRRLGAKHPGPERQVPKQEMLAENVYCIKEVRATPILGHKNRTHPPNLPHQEAHPGAALDPPLQPEGDPAPFQPPVGSRSSWSCAPRKRRQSRRLHCPSPVPRSGGLVPMLVPPPHPHHSPTADSGTPNISTRQ